MRNLLPSLPSLLILLSAAVSPTVTAADILPDNWQPFSGRVEFRQQKQLQGMAFPITSSGYLQLDNDTLLWHTRQPVEQQVLISGAGVSQLQQGQMQLIAGTEIIGQLMLAVLQQNNAFLSTYFQRQPQGDHCQQLTPVKAPVDQFFQHIELCGTAQLEQIRLLEKSGNTTSIELHYTTTTTEPEQ
ncbi:outer membrane lipoprotein carrier protein LolA [Chromatiaceae bacterium AAb-1]|nr:outer membrane lipoprotein carrier protein LolA [Chromatiaceae bacterium AAb-1]